MATTTRLAHHEEDHAIPALLATLKATPDPALRAALLSRLADRTAHPGEAELIRLVAETERLVADPGHEPPDHDAWDQDLWWTLAAARDRDRRAELLRQLHPWAAHHYGDGAAGILLQLADVEDPRLMPPYTGPYPLSIHARPPRRPSTQPAPPPLEGPGWRGLLAGGLPLPARPIAFLAAGLAAVAMAAVVLTAGSIGARMLAGAALVLIALAYVAWSCARGGRS